MWSWGVIYGDGEEGVTTFKSQAMEVAGITMAMRGLVMGMEVQAMEALQATEDHRVMVETDQLTHAHTQFILKDVWLFVVFV